MTKIESFPPPPAPREQALLFADAFKICAAIRALQAVRGLCAEFGAEERMEADLCHRAKYLGIATVEIWDKYDAFVLGQSGANARVRIGQGHFDPEVIKRMYKIKGEPNKHYPFHGTPDPKRNVASIVIHAGKVESVIFSLDHGLTNGVYALQVAP